MEDHLFGGEQSRNESDEVQNLIVQKAAEKLTFSNFGSIIHYYGSKKIFLTIFLNLSIL
jgi:hypothetical protein